MRVAPTDEKLHLSGASQKPVIPQPNEARMTRRPALYLLAVIFWLIAGCQTSSGVDYIPDPLVVATLTDTLTHGESRCRFTLRMNSADSLIDVDYEWNVDRTRSQLPGVEPVPVGEAGSFPREWIRSWGWSRPDNGVGPILNIPVALRRVRLPPVGD